MNSARIARRLRNRTDDTRDRDAMSESRKDVLLQALEAEVGGAPDDPRDSVHRGCGGLVANCDRIRAGRTPDLAATREEAFSNSVHHVPRTR